ncbi:MAG TPA: response regulator [Desulfobacterales bacterium]|nr:response regulator [Desulfobacterales bacterium]
MEDPIKLLIVDDSRLMRQVIGKIFESGNNVQVIGEAANGKEALGMIPSLKPDVITLDINMPVMDGLTALKHIMIKHPTPVVMCSTLTQEGASTTFDTLKFGAVDFIHKPSNQQPETLEEQCETIRKKVTMAAGVEIGAVRYLRPKARAGTSAQGTAYTHIIAICAAEGGYSALLKIIPLLSPALPTVFIAVLYESSGHVDSFVRYLDDNSSVKVERAIDAVPIESGVCYIASGDEHVTVHSFYGEYLKVTASPSPLHRDAIDRLMFSLADVMSERVVGIILSGAGDDGTEGIGEILRMNGVAIVQDPKTCLFKEMAISVTNTHKVSHIIPDSKIAENINKRFS